MKRPIFALACKLLIVATIFTVATAQTFTPKKRKKIIPGQMAIVYDERLSALRTRADVKAPLISRLRRDREVGIIGPARNVNGGPQFYPVAISRNIRGWIIVEALARPHQGQDAARLMNLLNDTKDEYGRIRLARLYAEQYRGKDLAPRALLVLAEAAEQAAVKLSREARRRVGDSDEAAGQNLSERDYMLNYVGLDRYNRQGITFDYDETTARLIYDGSAYREILKNYPRALEATEARQRLERIKNTKANISQSKR